MHRDMRQECVHRDKDHSIIGTNKDMLQCSDAHSNA